MSTHGIFYYIHLNRQIYEPNVNIYTLPNQEGKFYLTTIRRRLVKIKSNVKQDEKMSISFLKNVANNKITVYS